MAPDRKKEVNLQADLLFCLLLLLLLLVFFVATLGYKPIARRAPLIVMLPLAGMLIGQVVVLVKKLRQRQSEDVEVSLLPTIEAEKLKKALFLSLWMILLMLMIYFAGHAGGIALFLVFFLRFTSHERWGLSISLGLGVTFALYVLFEVILKIPLFPGAIYTYTTALIWS